eukprot:CAMPEP_0116032786 /NCGR_PEP_ID=MMETSP0321-20121206/18417_1 /TAXON_ID=163516 /ORGANISM="Leptocylindrus danicus var. danicus, Strain B650" /LENGTH=56 /DNA_ID=CAMNT_0003508369 /DNA_START=99 /DNA_END=266 /DNA_ORIENTATION=-
MSPSVFFSKLNAGTAAAEVSVVFVSASTAAPHENALLLRLLVAGSSDFDNDDDDET